MVKFLSSLLLSSVLLGAAYAAPIAEAKGDAAGLETRHQRPDYGAMNDKRDITLPTGDGTDGRELKYLTPTGDKGAIPHPRWPLSWTRTRLLGGGWVDEQTISDLPFSTGIAAAEIRMGPNVYRKFDRHRVGEWGVVLGGAGRINSVDDEGRTHVRAIKGPRGGSAPDAFTFPPGVTHGVQASDDGLELLIFFSDGETDFTEAAFTSSSQQSPRTPFEVCVSDIQQMLDGEA